MNRHLFLCSLIVLMTGVFVYAQNTTTTAGKALRIGKDTFHVTIGNDQIPFVGFGTDNPQALVDIKVPNKKQGTLKGFVYETVQDQIKNVDNSNENYLEAPRNLLKFSTSLLRTIDTYAMDDNLEFYDDNKDEIENLFHDKALDNYRYVTGTKDRYINRSIVFEDAYNLSDASKSFLLVRGQELNFQESVDDNDMSNNELSTFKRNIISFTDDKVVVGDWAEDRRAHFLSESLSDVKMVVVANRHHDTKATEINLGKARNLGSFLVRKVFPADENSKESFRSCFGSTNVDDNCYLPETEDGEYRGVDLDGTTLQISTEFLDDGYYNFSGGTLENFIRGPETQDYHVKNSYKYKMPFGVIESLDGTGTKIYDRNGNILRLGWKKHSTDAEIQYFTLSLGEQGSEEIFIELGKHQLDANSLPSGGRFPDQEDGVNEYKTFVINHPKTDSKYLSHAAIEGPSVDVFYTGTSTLINGKVILTLPDYFTALTHENNTTIQVTPIGSFDKVKVKKRSSWNKKKQEFILSSENNKSPITVDWVVKAVRKTNKTQIVEPNKKDVSLKGFGPYTYLE